MSDSPVDEVAEYLMREVKVILTPAEALEHAMSICRLIESVPDNLITDQDVIEAMKALDEEDRSGYL